MMKGVLKNLKLGTYIRLPYVTLDGVNHTYSFLQIIIVSLLLLSVLMINITDTMFQTT